jgi:hypothetical protein
MSIEVSLLVFILVMLTMVGVGAALAVWVLRPRLWPVRQREDMDTDEYDVSMLIEQCRGDDP